MGQGRSSLRCSESPGWAQPPVTGLGLELGNRGLSEVHGAELTGEGARPLPWARLRSVPRHRAAHDSRRETVRLVCVRTCQGPGRPELLWAHTGLAACLVNKLASGRKRRLCPGDCRRGSSTRATPRHGLCTSLTHPLTVGGLGAGSGPLCHPCPCCHPGTLLHRGSF